jgi:hypothetical protein
MVQFERAQKTTVPVSMIALSKRERIRVRVGLDVNRTIVQKTPY